MKFKSEPDNDVRDMDISSMSDVVFQLLIFFLVATNIQQEESQLKVAIPVDQQATEAQAVDLAEEVVIDIYDNGEVYWNGQYVDSPDSVDMPELKNILYELKQAYPNQSVVIRGQRDTQHQRIVAVLNACAFAGIDQITVPSDPSIYID